MGDDRSRLVYSTETAVPREEKAHGKPAADKAPPGLGRVIVRLDRKKRAGKSVTLIEGLPLGKGDLETLLRQLKADRGSGGTMKDGALEIQGDHCDAVISFLEKKGFRPKRSGG
jgi:translation initiation factor 1